MLTTDDVFLLLREVFNLPATFVFEQNMRPAQVPGWDSAGWMRLVITLEEKLNREIPLELFDTATTVRQVCDAVSSFTRNEF